MVAINRYDLAILATHDMNALYFRQIDAIPFVPLDLLATYCIDRCSTNMSNTTIMDYPLDAV